MSVKQICTLPSSWCCPQPPCKVIMTIKSSGYNHKLDIKDGRNHSESFKSSATTLKNLVEVEEARQFFLVNVIVLCQRIS